MKLNLKDVLGNIKGNFQFKKTNNVAAKTGSAGAIGIIVETNLLPVLAQKGIEIPPGVITTLIVAGFNYIFSWWKHRK